MTDIKPYTKRELDKEFKNLHTKLDEIIKLGKTTNGRITKLEFWKNRIIGGIAVLILIVVPLIIN